MISGCIVSYLALVHKARYVLLFFWLVVLVVSGIFAVRFPTDVSQNINPPHDAPSAIAKRTYNDVWSNQAGTTAFVLFAESTTSTKILNVSQYDIFDKALEYFAYTGNLSFPKYNFHLKDLTTSQKRGVTYSSYRSVMAAGLPKYVAEAYISGDGGAAKMTVTFPHPTDSEEAAAYSRDLQTGIDYLLARYGMSDSVTCKAFGLLPFLETISQATSRDIFTMFGIVLPIALVIFAFSLSAARYVILPILTLIITLSVVYGIMDGVASIIEVNSMVPGIAGAFTLALVIDYSYFLMCKFRKQIRCAGEMREEGIQPLMELVMSSAGRSVFISALAISACALGLVFFPVEMFRSIGICCIVAPLTAMAVTLNFVPAMLLAFPKFWINGAKPNCEDEEDEPAVDTHLSGVFQPLFADTTYIETVDDGALGAAGDGHGGAARRSALASNNGSNRPEGEGTALRTSRAQARPSRGGGGGANGSSEEISTPVKPNPNNGTGLASEGANSNTSNGSGRGGYGGFGNTPTQSFRGRQSTTMTQRSTIDQQKHNVSRHYRLVEFVTRSPQNYILICVILLLCATPVIYAFIENNQSNDLTQFIPRDSDLLPAWRHMQHTFAAGDVFPYFFLIDLSPAGLQFNRPPDNITKAQEGYTLVQEVLQSVVNEFPELPESAVASGVYNGAALKHNASLVNSTYWEFSRCLNETLNFFSTPSPDCLYQVILTTSVFSAPKLSWTYALLSPTFDPTSAEGVKFYHKFLDFIPKLEAKYPVKLYLSGYGAETEDIVSFANKTLPKVTAIVAAILFVFVALAFGSIGVPVRSVFTVSLNTMVVFGLANIIYVVKAFNFVGWNGLTGNGSIAWSVPYSVFLIIVGISLNYSLVSVTRVLEFYWLGVPTKQAIRFGVADTGREVTVAALMMFIVFFGLLFSQVPAMNELGMYLVLTSLVSGMVFRLFLSPPLMALLGDLNWWPMNSCNSFKFKFTPLVLPSGAAKTRATFHSEDFPEDRSPSRRTTNAGGTVYRASQQGGIDSDKV